MFCIFCYSQVGRHYLFSIEQWLIFLFSNFSGQNIYLKNPQAPSPHNQMVVPLWHSERFTKQLEERAEGRS